MLFVFFPARFALLSAMCHVDSSRCLALFFAPPSPVTPPFPPPCTHLLAWRRTTTATGLQKAEATPGQTAFQRIAAIAREMWRQEGVRSFYKGITPRVLRVAPGQAVVFAVYERVRKVMENLQGSSEDRIHSE